ncbi:hypothetical protein [Cellulomonas xylanilytica]|nr:hypothetical protein [Cellulomonas xylanilytica]
MTTKVSWDGLTEWFTTVDFAAWLAVAAFVLSVIALVVSIWVDRARVRVDLLPLKMLGQHPGQAARPLSVYEVTVTNTGKRPTKVRGIHLVLGESYSERFTRFHREKERSLIAVTTDDLARVSAALPMVLDVGDTATIYFDRVVVDAAVRAENVTQLHARAATSTAGYRGSRSVKVEKAEKASEVGRA